MRRVQIIPTGKQRSGHDQARHYVRIAIEILPAVLRHQIDRQILERLDTGLDAAQFGVGATGVARIVSLLNVAAGVEPARR
jgi:hypothetical protein